MRFDYRVIFIISALLFTLSTSLTVINYIQSVDETRKQLKNSSLPLMVDSIYSKIQKQLIEPNLIASMMSHDTFMKDWLVNEENDTEKITQYLAMIKTKYKMFTTFLVSENSRNYYTDQGMLEKISSDNKNNAWYFKFKNNPNENEINIDYNDFMGQSLIMFINHKIYDREFKMVGATGIGLKTSYINDMLKNFREVYDFNVFFVDSSGRILISETGLNDTKKYRNREELQKLIPTLINNEKPIYEYKDSGESFLLTKKYISELDLSLVVMAKIDNFTRSVKSAFYFNLASSFIITILIALFVILYMKRSRKT